MLCNKNKAKIIFYMAVTLFHKIVGKSIVPSEYVPRYIQTVSFEALYLLQPLLNLPKTMQGDFVLHN